MPNLFIVGSGQSGSIKVVGEAGCGLGDPTEMLTNRFRDGPRRSYMSYLPPCWNGKRLI